MNTVPYVLCPQNPLSFVATPVIFWSRYADDALDGAISYLTDEGWTILSTSQTITDDQATSVAFEVEKGGICEIYSLRNALTYMAEKHDD
jgi:hypothetical protein